MLSVNCDSCGMPLQEPGALVFAPPEDGWCVKYHICVKCWTESEQEKPKSKRRIKNAVQRVLGRLRH